MENLREMASLRVFYGKEMPPLAQWLRQRREAKERMARLRRENLSLLEAHLFPALDRLHEASPDTLSSLEAFAAALMDWRTNLDAGVYLVIHEALLSLARIRRDRDQIVKECYMVGMGHYYQNRMVEGLKDTYSAPFYFEGEMAFTEAASYFRFVEELGSEESVGFCLRALANVAISTKNHKRKIASSSRMLTIIADEKMRAFAPNLPWEAYLRKTHQQMSANRGMLSRDDLTQEEMAWVLDSCYEVFRPEEGKGNPSNRWLWPYYEMQYTCGYVDLDTTLLRLERLMENTPEDAFDESGLYGKVQLAIYYGVLMKKNPSALTEKKKVWVLEKAYRRMLKALLTCPPENFDDYFFYLVNLVLSDYYEADLPGVLTYKELTSLLMKRLCGELYVGSRKAGDMMEAFVSFMAEADESYFAELPLPGVGIGKEQEKEKGKGQEKEDKEQGKEQEKEQQKEQEKEQEKEALLSYARDCGLYHDFGLIQMNMEKLRGSRSLFERENDMYKLHTVLGHDNLMKRPSTRHLADVALGHHAWYGAPKGFPDSYQRNESPYRLMTDVMAVVSFLLESPERKIEEVAEEILAEEGRRFSPLVTVYVREKTLLERLEEIRRGEGEEEYYREIYEGLSQNA